MFGEKSDESFIGFDEIEVVLNSIIEQNNANKEQENKKDMSKMTWNLEMNKLVMKCYLMGEPSKIGYGKSYLEIIGFDGLEELQKACLLGTARILRKVLDCND